ncbi:adenosylcobinamide-GDP ribazoletransferase [Gluconacetobacter takamatsuzukensis]|uniref:Adenosylcobinamide-GDP ribazoletransferase n=1 Tax=Gluconacetobacter takamatsuzukensis TaxID=1286190 RepID=A0A7W4PR61_9PROT|nr:adenosylcobinamide-GDP ribazoletransferase [Gluconacetobacter takamatsuzukensis]MBB2205149.1 adenosylcobinamide-GDP ribazoletransferase [Gluconacetobacter takamatsuzukensis]
MSWLGRRRADLAAGIGLLTRLPVGWLSAGGAFDLGRSVWTWPLVGMALGATGGLAVDGLAAMGLARSLAAAWAVALLMLLTGGLHEDGLADMADGFGGGRDRARKLAIMRDSRIGSYGAMALGMALLIRVIAAAAAPHPAVAMAIAGGLGRAAMGGLCRAMKPARTDGLAAALPRIPRPALAACLLAPVAAALLLLPAGRALQACVAAAVVAALLGRLAQRQVGGLTGDVLGATAVCVDCCVLSLAGIAGPPG